MMRPTQTEDARNVSLITGSALLGLVVTAALFAGAAREVAPVNYTAVEAAEATPVAFESGAELDDRIYGTVRTRSGRSYTGYLRWDKNEGSWADLLDADKQTGRASQSGIRFGHIRRIESRGSRSADFTLRSGEVVRFGARATDLGTGLRALLIENGDQSSVELEWRDLESVEFEPAPARSAPVARRLYGTMVTSSGMEFTGHIAWDVDEIYTSDVLDGEDQNGVDREIFFGDIASIERASSRSARVILRNGEELIMSGTNDVNSSNNGISVSDPGLGQVKVTWRDLVAVHFGPSRAVATFDEFDGGHAIHGTVLTESGASATGDIAWDNDETMTWEMLNGDLRGVEFHVEFGKIAAIEKVPGGALVTLRDGREYRLSGSNDVDGSNRGLVIRNGSSIAKIDWREFRSARFDG